jgi:hypothetical protein
VAKATNFAPNAGLLACSCSNAANGWTADADYAAAIPTRAVTITHRPFA